MSRWKYQFSYDHWSQASWVSAAVEQSRRKANMVAQGDGKFGPWGWPQDPSKPKKNTQKFEGTFFIVSQQVSWCQLEIILNIYFLYLKR